QTVLQLTTPSNDVKPTVLELITYLHEHGVAASAFLPRLREIYEAGNHASHLVLAMVDLLPGDEARAFVLTHLQRSPNDRVVFQRALAMVLAEGCTPANLVRAATVTNAVRQHASPRLNAAYAADLFERVGDLH